MSDSSGALVSSIKYFPFGATRSGSVSTDKKFTGQRLDGTGLYYYGARYYDPVIGRFISTDKVAFDISDPQAINSYSYVGNNPLRYIDPTGQVRIDAEDDPGVLSPEVKAYWQEAGEFLTKYSDPMLDAWGIVDDYFEASDPTGSLEDLLAIEDYFDESLDPQDAPPDNFLTADWIPLALDTISLLADIVSIPLAPLTPAAMGAWTVSSVASAAGAAYTGYQYNHGKADLTDVTVTTANFSLGMIPFTGVTNSWGQLIYDLWGQGLFE